MQAERVERIAEIVSEALEFEGDERKRTVLDLCRGDADLQSEVDSLLSFEKKARVFIEMPAFELAAEIVADENGELNPGDLLGNYKIVLPLGQGRTGEVYLAEDRTLGRPVAIKLLKSRHDAARIVRRFRQEEQILAGLTHPNIAWLYGAAIAPAGIPYLVMEYVEGPRLDHYCRDKELSVRERLVLFRKICAAVAYGHQHLILHRNIKPANIRVAPDGEPKLLDFGIAEPLNATVSTIAQQTLAATVVSEYASPEQVRGEKLTTATDVYSLGVLLYELLTQQRPYGTTSHRLGEVARAITEKEPIKPSTAVADGNSKFENLVRNGAKRSRTDGNSNLLRGDLDHIILKALRKEPARRYGSVAQFSEDIRRYLAGLPVISGSNVLLYRIGKFIQRHRVSVAGAAVFVLGLFSAIVLATARARQADRHREMAEQRYNELRQLADSLIIEIRDSLKNLPSTQRGPAAIAETIDKGGDPFVVDVRTRLEDPAGEQLGGGGEQPENNQPPAETTAEAQTDVPGTVDGRRKLLQIREQIASANPKNVQVQFDLSVAQADLSEALTATGDANAALEQAQQAHSIVQRLSADDPANGLYRRNIGLCDEKIGDAYSFLASSKKQSRSRRVKNWIKARAAYKQGLDVFARLRDEGKLVPADSGFAEHFGAKIAECDARLKGSRR